jgi:hypothetical protein
MVITSVTPLAGRRKLLGGCVVVLFMTLLTVLPPWVEMLVSESTWDTPIVKEFRLQPYLDATWTGGLTTRELASGGRTYTVIGIHQGNEFTQAKFKQAQLLVFDDQRRLVGQQAFEDWLERIELVPLGQERTAILCGTSGTKADIQDERTFLFEVRDGQLTPLWHGQELEGCLLPLCEGGITVTHFNTAFEDTDGDGLKEVLQQPMTKRLGAGSVVLESVEGTPVVYAWDGERYR